MYYIALNESKEHIAILNNEILYHYAEMTDSYKMLPFKASRTATIHQVYINIRHTPTVHRFLKYSPFTNHKGTIFIV